MGEALGHCLHGCHVDVNFCRNGNGGVAELLSRDELTKDQLLKQRGRRLRQVEAPPQHEPGDDVPPVGIFFSISLCSDVTAERVHDDDSAVKKFVWCIDCSPSIAVHRLQSLGALSFNFAVHCFVHQKLAHFISGAKTDGEIPFMRNSMENLCKCAQADQVDFGLIEL